MWRVVKKASRKKTKLESVLDPRQVVLIILGAGINFSLGFGLFSSGAIALIASQGGVLFTSGIPAQASILAIEYFLVGTIYSTVTSLALKPKRIINPIFVQLVTASFVPILLFYLLVTLIPAISISLAAFVAFVLFWLALAMFLSAGLGQFLLVKYFVGLNGTKEDTRSATLMLNAKLKDVLTVLDAEPVHRAFGLTLQRSRKGKLSVFKTSDKVSEQFYLLVIEDPVDNEKTQLATVAYKLGVFGIIPGEGEAKLLDEMRSRELQHILQEKRIAYLEVDAPEALTSAYGYALEPTQTKFLSMRSSEPHLGFIFVGIVVMFGLTTILWKLGILPLDLYETFLIFAGLSLLFDFLPSLRRHKDENTNNN